jgi:lysophospholipase L1-like esterase
MLLFLRLQLLYFEHRRLTYSVLMAISLLGGVGLFSVPRIAGASSMIFRPAEHVQVEHTPSLVAASAALPGSSATDRMTSDELDSGTHDVAINLIGDSLVSGRDADYTRAFAGYGLTLRTDGAGSRSLRYGWLCKHQDRVVTAVEPSSPDCNRQGLELVRWWVESNQLRDVLVVALGTNDAYRRTDDVTASLVELRRLLGAHPLVLVGTSSLPMRQAFNNWNDTATQWCVTDLDCRFLDWAGDPDGQDPRHFSSDGVHATTLGGIARAEFIALELSR